MTRVPGGPGIPSQAPSGPAGGSWPFPAGRTLAGWWRQLEAFHPRSLSLAHLLIHQVEALAHSVSRESLDPFSLLTLEALLASPSTEAVHNALHLEPAVLAQLLRALSSLALIRPSSSENGVWVVEDAGRQALEAGGLTRTNDHRRTFHFVEPAEGGRKPEYVPLSPSPFAFVPSVAPPAVPFDPGLLRQCIEQPAEWKSRRGFPHDVTEVHGVNAGEELSWPKVVVDHPATALVAFATTADELLGFGARTEGWVLEPEPLLRLREGWQEVFPELTVEPPLESWWQAWRAWCHPRSIPPAESDGCVLERADHRLVVRAPKKLVERLRIARSDALKGEAWVLAGSGSTRTAALLEIVEGA